MLCRTAIYDRSAKVLARAGPLCCITVLSKDPGLRLRTAASRLYC